MTGSEHCISHGESSAGSEAGSNIRQDVRTGHTVMSSLLRKINFFDFDVFENYRQVIHKNYGRTEKISQQIRLCKDTINIKKVKKQRRIMGGHYAH